MIRAVLEGAIYKLYLITNAARNDGKASSDRAGGRLARLNLG